MAEALTEQKFDEGEINLLDYWWVVWKYKCLIGVLFVVSVSGALTYSKLSPKIYVSTTTILMPREGGGGGGLLSVIAATGLGEKIPGASVPSFSSFSPNVDLFKSVLKSRILAKNIVEEFDLMNYYNARHIEHAIGSLMGATSISKAKDGLIEIEVEDTDPKMAAKIANAYPDHLDRLMARLGTGAAGRERRFIERQLAKIEIDLKMAEETMRKFQEKSKAISLKDQAVGAISVDGRLKGEIIASEVRLQMMRNFATESNPEVIKLKGTIRELKRQLAQSQFGAGLDLPPLTDNPGHTKKELHLPAVRFPEVGLEFVRLARNLRVQEAVYMMLTQQLEQAKIAEAKDTAVVQVLDRAVPALQKSRPKTRSSIVIAGAVSLFLGIFLAFFLEYIQRQRAAEQQVRQ